MAFLIFSYFFIKKYNQSQLRYQNKILKYNFPAIIFSLFIITPALGLILIYYLDFVLFLMLGFSCVIGTATYYRE